MSLTSVHALALWIAHSADSESQEEEKVKKEPEEEEEKSEEKETNGQETVKSDDADTNREVRTCLSVLAHASYECL